MHSMADFHDAPLFPDPSGRDASSAAPSEATFGLSAELRALLQDTSEREPGARSRQADAIMAAVRTMPAPRRSLLPPSMTRWRRRGVLAPAGGVAVAFLLTMWFGVTSLTDVFSRSSAMLARAEVLGDTVIPRLVPAAERAVVAHGGRLEQALRDTLYDTMRIVRFALHAPAATQVRLVRAASNVPLGDVARVASGLWELRTVVPRAAGTRDAVSRSFAFVVDDTHRVPVRGVLPATYRLPVHAPVHVPVHTSADSSF
jgi:hypothetical protein